MNKATETDHNDPVDEARALVVHAQNLYRSRGYLRDHPDQVYDVLEALEESARYLDYIVEEASASYSEHAPTAVTMFGDEIAGARVAVYAAGYLKAASCSVRSLRDQIMYATAEVDRLSWPQHDPVAAEQLREYRELLDRRARHIDPDPEAGPTSTTTSTRNAIES